jgi:RNA polymerase sigma-70 factor (ECF subfamily)
LSRRRAKADPFVELLQPLQKSLEAYCRRMLRDQSLTEDVLQAAIASAFARFDRYAEGTNFTAWIFRFVTLEIFNRNRKQEPIVLGELPVDMPVEESWDLVTHADMFAAMLEAPEVVLDDFEDIVAEALKRLPPAERAVLLLRAIGEFEYREIHELLSIPMGSVMGYLSRARQRLRLALADYAAERGLYREQRPRTSPAKGEGEENTGKAQP